MKKSIVVSLLVTCTFLLTFLSCNLDASKGVFHNVVLAQEYSETKVHPFLCRLVSKKIGETYYFDYFFVSDDGIQVFNDETKTVSTVLSNKSLSEDFFKYGNNYIKYNQLIREAAINKIYDEGDGTYAIYVLCLTGNGDLISGYILKEEGTYSFYVEHMSWPSLYESPTDFEKSSMPDTESIYKSSEGNYYRNIVRELTPGGYFICSPKEEEGNGDDYPSMNDNEYYNKLYYWSHEREEYNGVITSTDCLLDYNTGVVDYLAEDPVGEQTGIVLVGSSQHCMYIYEGAGRGSTAVLNKLVGNDEIKLNEGLIGFKYMGSIEDSDSGYDSDKKNISNYAFLQMTYSSSTYYYTLYSHDDGSGSLTALMTLSNKPNRYYMQTPMIRYTYGSDETGPEILSIKGYEAFNDYNWTDKTTFGSVTANYKTELNETDMVNIRPVTFCDDKEIGKKMEGHSKYEPVEFVIATDDNFLYVLYYYSYVGSTIKKNDVPSVLTISMYSE